MRLNTVTRFPHPVLVEDSADYALGEFSIDFTVSECKNSGDVSIQFAPTLTQSEIQDLVVCGKASVILFIECLRTYYNHQHPLTLEPGEIAFTKGELRDKVKLRPYVIATEKIDGYTSAELHPEFGGHEWTFHRSEVLAIGSETTIDIGLDKLAPMESIFELATNDEIPDGETRVKLESSRITILASKSTHKSLNDLRSTGFGKLALLNGVYLPVLMQVLDALSKGASIYEDYRWHSVFTKTCTHLGINLDAPDLLEDAQALFQAPLGKFLAAKEFKS